MRLVASTATGEEGWNIQGDGWVPRYQEHGECQHLQGGTDRVRSGCDRRVIAIVIQEIYHWDIQRLFHSCRKILIFSLNPSSKYSVGGLKRPMHNQIPYMVHILVYEQYNQYSLQPWCRIHITSQCRKWKFGANIVFWPQSLHAVSQCEPTTLGILGLCSGRRKNSQLQPCRLSRECTLNAVVYFSDGDVCTSDMHPVFLQWLCFIVDCCLFCNNSVSVFMFYPFTVFSSAFELPPWMRSELAVAVHKRRRNLYERKCTRVHCVCCVYCFHNTRYNTSVGSVSFWTKICSSLICFRWW